MKPVFAYSTTVLTFSQAPQRPLQRQEQLQPEVDSAAGVPFVGEPIALEQTLELTWPRLPLTDLILLEAFFDLVDGMVEPFAYTDVSGSTKTVRFAAPELEYNEIAWQRYAVTVTLLEEP